MEHNCQTSMKTQNTVNECSLEDCERAYDAAFEKLEGLINKLLHLGLPDPSILFEATAGKPLGIFFQRWEDVDRPYASSTSDAIRKEIDTFFC